MFAGLLGGELTGLQGIPGWLHRFVAVARFPHIASLKIAESIPIYELEHLLRVGEYAFSNFQIIRFDQSLGSPRSFLGRPDSVEPPRSGRCPREFWRKSATISRLSADTHDDGQPEQIGFLVEQLSASMYLCGNR